LVTTLLTLNDQQVFIGNVRFEGPDVRVCKYAITTCIRVRIGCTTLVPAGDIDQFVKDLSRIAGKLPLKVFIVNLFEESSIHISR
jgi:hypothetical protein